MKKNIIVAVLVLALSAVFAQEEIKEAIIEANESTENQEIIVESSEITENQISKAETIITENNNKVPEELEGILKPEVYFEIEEKGYALREYKYREECTFDLLPNTPYAKDAGNSWEKFGKNEEPVYSFEKLFLVKKSELTTKGVEADIQRISEVLRGISNMEGMMYFSNSGHKWETLYTEAYAIDNLKDKNRVPDRTEGSADGEKILAFVHDKTFNDCYYSIDYHQNEKEFRQCYTVAKDIWVGIFRGVKPGFMKINVVISDVGSQFIVYFFVQSKYTAPGMMEKKISNSLKARIDAIALWFFGHFDLVNGENIGIKFNAKRDESADNSEVD